MPGGILDIILDMEMIRELEIVHGGVTKPKNLDTIRSCAIEEVVPVFGTWLPKAEAYIFVRCTNNGLA